jgi:hypothetical protein
MRRATMWSLACAAVSISLFWIHAVAAPADDIIFAPKAFFDFGDAAVEISGTLTGEDVPFKNNTVVVACYKDRRECLTYSIAQAGPNQMGRLGGPVIYPITTWNAYEVIATEDESAFAWHTCGHNNGLLGALQPVDLLFELGDPLLALRQGARRIRDPIYLGHEPLNP